MHDRLETLYAGICGAFVLGGIVIVTFSMVLLACPNPSVVRDEVVYRAEAEYMERVALQSSEHLLTFIKAHCRCEGGKFSTEQCERAADVALVASTRAGWHKAMMLYNAGLLDVRPSKEPPVIPAPESLCPTAEGGAQ